MIVAAEEAFDAFTDAGIEEMSVFVAGPELQGQTRRHKFLFEFSRCHRISAAFEDFAHQTLLVLQIGVHPLPKRDVEIG